MREIEPELTTKGVSLVPIGNGRPTFIAGFRQTTGFTGPVYTDPSRRTFEAASLKRTMWSLFRPESLVAGLRAARKGFFFKGKLQGDGLQLGGVLVVRPPDRVTLHYASRFAGDHASNDTIRRAMA